MHRVGVVGRHAGRLRQRPEPIGRRCRRATRPAVRSRVRGTVPAAPVRLDEPTSSWSLSTIMATWSVGAQASEARSPPPSTTAGCRGAPTPAATGRRRAATRPARRTATAPTTPARRRARPALRSTSANSPIAGEPDAPHRAEMLLRVEHEPDGVDLAVEVHGELGHAGDRLVDVDERRRSVGGDQPPGDAEVAVEPRVVEDAAVHLDRRVASSRTTPASGCGFTRRHGESVWPPTMRNGSGGIGRSVGQPPRDQGRVTDDVAGGRHFGPVVGFVEPVRSRSAARSSTRPRATATATRRGRRSDRRRRRIGRRRIAACVRACRVSPSGTGPWGGRCHAGGWSR